MQVTKNTVENLRAKFEAVLAGDESMPVSREPRPPHANREFTQAARIIYLPDLTGTNHNAIR